MVDIAVDPRIELLMAVQSADPEYCAHGPLLRPPYPHPYLHAVRDLVGRHDTHPAMAHWRDLCANGFTFDAPVRFALCHSPLPDFRPLFDYGPYLAGRAGGAERLPPFADALRDFAATTDFLGFLSAWRQEFNRYEAQARSVVDPAWPGMLDAYAGRPRAALRVILAPQSGGSYGPTLELPEGRVSYGVIAPSGDAEGPSFDDPAHMKRLVLHEGAHGFVNPALDTCTRELEASADLLTPIAERMRDQAYPRWQTVVCEHVVRAVVARLSPDPNAVLAREEQSGFLYIRPVADALADYEANRGAYPDLWAFAPRIAAVLRRLAEGPTHA